MYRLQPRARVPGHKAATKRWLIWRKRKPLNARAPLRIFFDAQDTLLCAKRTCIRRGPVEIFIGIQIAYLKYGFVQKSRWPSGRAEICVCTGQVKWTVNNPVMQGAIGVGPLILLLAVCPSGRRTGWAARRLNLLTSSEVPRLAFIL